MRKEDQAVMSSSPFHYVPIPNVSFGVGESVLGLKDCDFKCDMKVAYRPSLDSTEEMEPLFGWVI